MEPVPPRPHPATKLLEATAIVIFTILIVGSFIVAAAYSRLVLQSEQMAAVVSATLVDLANDDREARDLGALTINQTLVDAAQAKANDMAEKGYFAHTSPEGLGSWYWFSLVGYSFSHAGENLAVNFSDSENVENAWMESPTHRANIMNGNFTEIGIATAVGEYKGKKTTFVVQMFGTPRAVAAAPAPIRTVVPENPEEPAVAVVEAEEANVLGSVAPEVPRYATPVETLASSPETLLRVFYLLCALVILVALLAATELEFKKHHFRHVAAAAFLLILMVGLTIAADRFLFAPIILS